MSNTPNESLQDLVATLQTHIKELRRTGNIFALLEAATTAANQIEHQVGENLGDPERQALTTVKRFTYNAAADAWPGWSTPPAPLDSQHLLTAQDLAQRSLSLVRKLDLGPIQEGTGIWLCGAFDLALGRYADAVHAFIIARQHYTAANAPGLVLLTEGYIAIVRQVSGQQTPADEKTLDQISAEITAGSFEDGAAWITQLHTALKAFSH
jgi:hypothetical protein